MEKKEFQAESKRLLDLMINSIYTNQEIFLREIISNASDAIDKLAYQALTDQSVGLNRSDFAITLKADEKYRLLTISDNGIGMTQEEMEENLGTIAKSGSLQFKKDLAADADVDIIGQFGVGFYSAFMVSEAVTVISKKFGSDQAYMWQSSGRTAIPSPLRAGRRGYRCDSQAQGRHRGRELLPVPQELRAAEPGEEILRLHPLSHQDGRGDPEAQGAARGRGKKEDAKPEYETVVETETFNSMVPCGSGRRRTSPRTNTPSSIGTSSSTSRLR